MLCSAARVLRAVPELCEELAAGGRRAPHQGSCRGISALGREETEVEKGRHAHVLGTFGT